MNIWIVTAVVLKTLATCFAGVVGGVLALRETHTVVYTRFHRNRLIFRPAFICMSMGKIALGIILLALAVLLWFV